MCDISLRKRLLARKSEIEAALLELDRIERLVEGPEGAMGAALH